jgi:hypothetical protein
VSGSGKKSGNGARTRGVPEPWRHGGTVHFQTERLWVFSKPIAPSGLQSR